MRRPNENPGSYPLLKQGTASTSSLADLSSSLAKMLVAIAWTISLSSIAPTTLKADTSNIKISPTWTDDSHFWFLRTSSDGLVERVDVDAASGKLIAKSVGADSPDRSMMGGMVEPSGSAGSRVRVRFVNRAKVPVTLGWVSSSGSQKDYATLQPGQATQQSTFVGHSWVATDAMGRFYGSIVADQSGKSVVIGQTFERVSAEEKETATPGVDIPSRMQAKLPSGLQWRYPTKSPDGRFVVAWQAKLLEAQPVHLIESSPEGGGRAVLKSTPYRLPGDAMDQYQAFAWDVKTETLQALDLPKIDFGEPVFRWRDQHTLLVEKIDRGHQRFRLFAVDVKSGQVATLLDEKTDTFLWTVHRSPVPLVTYLDNGNEAIYASEKTGWRHLSLIDLDGRNQPRPITRGEYVVREILHVDEIARTIDLIVGCFHEGQDPYHRHFVRVGLDDGRLVPVTDADGDHRFRFSPTRRWVVATHSRADQPPVHELRDCRDGRLVATLARAVRSGDNLPPLPVVFSAKGRDGKTDIWGTITFPDGFEMATSDQYPILESIYAGPHDHHVPKEYRDFSEPSDLNQLGFVVVQIDGMGTAHRSKEFHDVCWQNLQDAGFPDRIAWIKAAAARYPCMDLSRVGIFGTSAGGQNAAGALIWHSDFYKAAVASCGCHDNRMDKASWNEQWMGYPVGPHYSAASNIDNAAKLKGKLMLILGELDTNVPPESTLRLVDALIDAEKYFDFVMVPGGGHGSGGAYGWQRIKTFFQEAFLPTAERIQN